MRLRLAVLAMVCLTLGGPSFAAPPEPPPVIVGVQPASMWEVTNPPPDNPHMLPLTDVTTPVGPGVREDAFGGTDLFCENAHANRSFPLSQPRSAQQTLLSFYYEAGQTGVYVTTSMHLSFYLLGAQVGQTQVIRALDPPNGVNGSDPVEFPVTHVASGAVATLELGVLLGNVQFNEIRVQLNQYGCEMTGFQILSGFTLSNLTLVCPPEPKETDNIWVDAASPAPVSPYALRSRAARTINEALLAARATGKRTIFVLRGTYTEEVRIDKTFNGLKLIGESYGNCLQPTLDGQQVRRLIRIDGAKNVTICGFNIINGKPPEAQSNGGGMRVMNSEKITLEFLCFEKNEVADGTGGGIYAQSSEGTIEDCVFQNGNVAKRAGGAAAIKSFAHDPDRAWLFERCRFLENEATHGVGGGVAVFGDHEDLTAFERSKDGGQRVVFRDCSFERNRALRPDRTVRGNGNGGAFYCEGEDSIINMIDVEFKNNRGEFNGGAITSGGVSTVSLFGSKVKFEKNSAPEGGACYATTLGKIVVAPAKGARAGFSDNSATEGSGGAMHATCGGILEVRDSVFRGNTAEEWGGAVSGRESRLMLNNCRFMNSGEGPNRAHLDGGAIALRSVDSRNHLCNLIPSILVIEGVLIENSKAEGRGGAIFAEYGDALAAKITLISVAGTPKLNDGPEKGNLISGMIAGSGLHGVTADGICLRDTGESQGTLLQASLADIFPPFGPIRNRYLGGIQLTNEDTVTSMTVAPRAVTPGTAIAADSVCNTQINLFGGGGEVCVFEPLQDVLNLSSCTIQGFQLGIDAVDSSRLQVRNCRVLGNKSGIVLDHTIAEVDQSRIEGNGEGIDILDPDARYLKFLAIHNNSFLPGPDGSYGVRVGTDALPSPDKGLSLIQINLNRIRGFSSVGQYGVGITMGGHTPHFGVDALHNDWGEGTDKKNKGPNDPSDDTAEGGLVNLNPGASNVTDGVYYADPTKRKP